MILNNLAKVITLFANTFVYTYGHDAFSVWASKDNITAMHRIIIFVTILDNDDTLFKDNKRKCWQFQNDIRLDMAIYIHRSFPIATHLWVFFA